MDGAKHDGCSRRDTLPNIHGFREKGEMLRNTKYNGDRKIIACHLRKMYNFDLVEEIYCLEIYGSPRCVDILCIDKRTTDLSLIQP